MDANVRTLGRGAKCHALKLTKIRPLNAESHNVPSLIDLNKARQRHVRHFYEYIVKKLRLHPVYIVTVFIFRLRPVLYAVRCLSDI